MAGYVPDAGGAAASTPGGVSSMGMSGVSDGAGNGHKQFLAALVAAGRRTYWNGEGDREAPVNSARPGAPLADEMDRVGSGTTDELD